LSRKKINKKNARNLINDVTSKNAVYKSRVSKQLSLKSLVGSNAGESGFALGLRKEH